MNHKSIARVAGRSFWNIFKLFSYALDGILSFSLLPLRTWCGLLLKLQKIQVDYSTIGVKLSLGL